METEEEKWIKHYSSLHQILLVGEGDFSFSLSLALAFGTASNITASSLDSYGELIIKYKNANANLFALKFNGASILHEVDVKKIKLHPGLEKRKFDRIIYNFPHAGFHGKEHKPGVIKLHRNLACEFFRNACDMLQENGEIHVSHKTTYPFNNWKIGDLASNYALEMIECADFKIEDYPGYTNKKGTGSKCDEPFPLGKCSTFKFMLCTAGATKLARVRKRKLDLVTVKYLEIPIQIEQQLAALFDKGLPYCPFTFTNDMPLHNALTRHSSIRNECRRIFGGYLNHVEQTFGRIGYDVRGSLNDALRLGFERYTSEVRGRPLSGYIDILKELHQMSVLKSQRLKQMLANRDMQM
ncbi:uncharacterized protein At4g26485-like [Olea europaea var. sylvestris]|uniref:uncharacterized protein At4g26485-like n=1 Tax=Olea europaea var. sylvestris TaxID=158386 RepID=UPI000C1D24B9|nr:uncharacterized protein At4g26485-like [Olea europaea var. sylvestris]